MSPNPRPILGQNPRVMIFSRVQVGHAKMHLCPTPVTDSEQHSLKWHKILNAYGCKKSAHSLLTWGTSPQAITEK